MEDEAGLYLTCFLYPTPSLVLTERAKLLMENESLEQQNAEMQSLLREAGIANYTIWNVGNELFGSYECEKGAAYAAKVQAESPVVARWNEYMKDVMEMEMDPETGAQPKLRQVFLFE